MLQAPPLLGLGCEHKRLLNVDINNDKEIY